MFSLFVALLLMMNAAGQIGAHSADSDRIEPAMQLTATVDYAGFSTPSALSSTAVPTPLPTVERPEGHDLVTILLLGSDTDNPVNAGRTDSLMLVIIDRTDQAVKLLSLPRDLFVYVPGWSMQRINTAYAFGERTLGEGQGFGVLQQAVLYNLGLKADFYARVDFAGFKALIDALGGVTVTVSCALQDWRLSDPSLDPLLEESWELYTLLVGRHLLNGEMALWYARSRRTSSDFDRGRRQQDIIRAIWQRARQLGLLDQLSVFWSQMVPLVETNLSLPDVLGLVPLGVSLDAADIHRYTIDPSLHVRSWQTPDGASVQLPDGEALQALLQRMVEPATRNRLVQGGARVEVVNAAGYPDLDYVVVDLLSWHGFRALPGGADQGGVKEGTAIYDLTGRVKGSDLDGLLEALRLPEGAVVVEPDANATVDYRVVLGSDYRACGFNVRAPVPTPTPQ